MRKLSLLGSLVALLVCASPAAARSFDLAGCLAYNGEKMRGWCEERKQQHDLREARLARNHCASRRKSEDMRNYCLAIENSSGCPCWQIGSPALRGQCVREMGKVLDCLGPARVRGPRPRAPLGR